MAARSRKKRSIPTPEVLLDNAAEFTLFETGRQAVAHGVRLRSFQVGGLPVIDHFPRRMRLEEKQIQTVRVCLEYLGRMWLLASLENDG